MADFQTCYLWMMANEDSTFSYAEAPDAPPGAAAISGVNSKSFPAEFAAIAAIPQAERGPTVRAFYQDKFWSPWYARLSTNDVAKRVFDEAVNGGAKTAVRMLQLAVNNVSTQATSVDGVWGPKTVDDSNACNQEELVQTFITVRRAHYRSIAASNPADARYLAAWLERASK